MTDPGLPDQVVLRPGEEHVLRLPSRGLAGFRWETAVEGSAVEVVHEVSTPEVAPGAAGDELVTLRAKTVGRATVTVVRRRRWGPPGKTERVETARIDVAVVEGEERRLSERSR